MQTPQSPAHWGSSLSCDCSLVLNLPIVLLHQHKRLLAEREAAPLQWGVYMRQGLLQHG